VDGRIQSHVVRSNEILTEVVIPPAVANSRTSFEKLRPRGVWDFAMASLAVNLHMQGNVIAAARVVFGGIAGKPLRETTVESLLQGKTLTASLANDVVPKALANAAPLKYNAMKIEMAKGLLASALDTLAAA
jgi:xanthine dehydrogenase YagS FAD-binding subunit